MLPTRCGGTKGACSNGTENPESQVHVAGDFVLANQHDRT